MARSASPQMFTDWDGLMDDLFHNRDLSGFIESPHESSSGIASDSPTLHRPPSSSNSSLSTYKFRSSPDTDDQRHQHSWPHRLSNGYSSSSSSNDNVYLQDHPDPANPSALHEVRLYAQVHHRSTHSRQGHTSAERSTHRAVSMLGTDDIDGMCGASNAASSVDMMYGYRPKPAKRHISALRELPDETMLRVLGYLRTDDLCRCARVSRRWYNLVWSPPLWTRIQINDESLNIDKALKALLKRLSYETPRVCLTLERIDLTQCSQLSDRGLLLIGKRCPELRQLELKGCHNVTDAALSQVISRCINLQHLNTSGCSAITCIQLPPEATTGTNSSQGVQIFLRHLDMTDCHLVDDIGLTLIADHCPQLQYLYLRRCIRVGDQGIQHMSASCSHLKELSVSDCRLITDFGLRELSQLKGNLRYVSVAKCEKVSDVGVRYLAKYCTKLRYLNVRGCEAVSDDSIVLLAQNCPRLKSLDVGKCDVTDAGLEAIAFQCNQLKKLSLKSCDAVTDDGIRSVADGCKRLCQLNIQDCHLSVDAYRYVKKKLKKCIIEHTNPSFY